ncbi:class I SAM-dependent methyltransferase [Ktedonospora formicarum]|uniref:Class I SAM-dependent methyltransferase n=1 Tax=Ktedonospora formicarum TaxID=2778364 RepID=A0A8J3MU73_9CHLR|nr:methyltransferase domain-containing protein [Ktedonospora formicarum]GHO45125.1 class I SAM-dependent methyltransferase [Ktedonospora formicarum]
MNVEGNPSNDAVIQSWSTYSRSMIEALGNEGDFARQHILNPHLFSLLGDLSGKTIMDAGCGHGYLSRLMAQRGARVYAIEPSENLYRYAIEQEQKTPLGITYLQEDLTVMPSRTKLTDGFDALVANMVFMDIPDYEDAIHNCISLLKPGGSLIFSITHPCFEESSSEWETKGYVAVHEYLHEHTHPNLYGYTFHRPLSAYLNLLMRAGCTLQQIIEPGLAPELVEGQPARERSVHVPQFLLVHALRTRE